MLKLDFKIGARLLIKDNIWIEVLRFHEGQVALGISAPPDVEVNREKTAISKGIITAAQASGTPRCRPDPDNAKPETRNPKPSVAPRPPVDPLEETLRLVRSAAETNGHERHPRHD